MISPTNPATPPPDAARPRELQLSDNVRQCRGGRECHERCLGRQREGCTRRGGCASARYRQFRAEPIIAEILSRAGGSPFLCQRKSFSPTRFLVCSSLPSLPRVSTFVLCLTVAPCFVHYPHDPWLLHLIRSPTPARTVTNPILGLGLSTRSLAAANSSIPFSRQSLDL